MAAERSPRMAADFKSRLFSVAFLIVVLTRFVLLLERLIAENTTLFLSLEGALARAFSIREREESISCRSMSGTPRWFIMLSKTTTFSMRLRTSSLKARSLGSIEPKLSG